MPVRSCVGCRQRRAQPELVRVTRARHGAGWTIAADGPSNGRGAWLCRSNDGDAVAAQCLERALDRRQFERAWRVALEPQDTEAIRAALRSAEEITD